MKSFGLFSNTYCLVSALMVPPSYLTTSPGRTLWPISVTISPFTLTTPVWISTSASRREQIPALDRYLFRRISSSLNEGSGSPLRTFGGKWNFLGSSLALAVVFVNGFLEFSAPAFEVLVGFFGPAEVVALPFAAGFLPALPVFFVFITSINYGAKIGGLIGILNFISSVGPPGSFREHPGLTFPLKQ